ncbi:MAG: hypothetical protein Q7K45_02805 [Nanoarchaeota archaeon]|nr:hypothetical protein [Nanoarchaeota archaeon]
MKSLASLLFAAALALFPSKSNAEQPYYSHPRQIEFNDADAVVLGVNAAIGCAFGVVPSIARKNKVSKVLEDCLKGVLAGTVIYAGEKAASHSSTPGLGWAAHILVGDGVSMRENLALGNGLFDRLAYDVGPVRVSLGTKEANSGKNVQWHLLPGSLVGIADNIAYRSDWNEKATLYSGTIVFDYYREDGFLLSGSFWGGTTTGNVVTMNHAILRPTENGEIGHLIPLHPDDFTQAYNHEQVHAAQYREYGSLDLVLRLSDIYRRTMDKTHLSLGSDIVAMTLMSVPGGYPVAEFPAR